MIDPGEIACAGAGAAQTRRIAPPDARDRGKDHLALRRRAARDSALFGRPRDRGRDYHRHLAAATSNTCSTAT
jgi:hypothetical protein